LARPSSGGATTRTRRTPSRSPANASDRDRGWTRAEIIARRIVIDLRARDHLLVADPIVPFSQCMI
jgi:hypothetical protein